MQFHMIICGLDSIEARRWINATLVNMIDEENPESLKPLIDGGTEGRSDIPRQLALYVLIYDLRRFPRPGTSYLPNHNGLLRVLYLPSQQAYGFSHLHHCKHAATTRTLYRMGVCAGGAARPCWYAASLQTGLAIH